METETLIFSVFLLFLSWVISRCLVDFLNAQSLPNKIVSLLWPRGGDFEKHHLFAWLFLQLSALVFSSVVRSIGLRDSWLGTLIMTVIVLPISLLALQVMKHFFHNRI